ncbi:unnamed protein product, partial [Medioppia subpectinata]
MFPSFTLIISAIFTVYIFHSIHTIYKLYNPEECDPKTDLCLNPSFTRKDIFTLYLCTSPDEHPLAHSLSCIYENNRFSLIEDYKLSLSVSLPPQTLRNGSLYMHAVLTSLKNFKEINKEVLLHRSTFTAVTPLTRYALKETKAFNLLNTQTDQQIEKPSKNKKSSHNRPPVNETNPMPLEVVYEPTSIGKLRFMLIIEGSLKSMTKMGFTESDSDDIKGIFFDTNIYLLLVTIFVTSFHVLFDFLAFKNDIQFWRKRKSMEGLSFSSLLWRCVSQFVITLYLLDNK